MRKLIVSSLIVIFAITMNLGVSFAKEKKEILIYSARFGGVNYMAGVTLAELLNKNHPSIKASCLESAGSIENIKRGADDPNDRAKTVRLGVSFPYWAAKDGLAPLFKRKHENMKLMFSHMISLGGLVATADPNIRVPADLKGKRVGVGERGSAFLVETQLLLRDMWGIWDQIKPEYLGFKAARDAFMDGLIDAVYSPGNVPGKGKYGVHPLMKSALQLKKGLHFVQLTEEDVAKGAKASGWPLSTMVVPSGSFRKNVPDQDAVVFNSVLMFWAYEDLPADIAYEITKIAHENTKKFGEAHAAMRIMSPETMTFLPAASEQEIHPGALKYYKEKGVPLLIGGKTPDF